jgi:uncharacterized iron-regulated membrane protein
MAARKTDLGAALTGLVLGASVLFLLLLTIVWLTNRHFEGREKAEPSATPPAATAPATAPATSPATTPPATAPATAPPAAQVPSNP